MAAWCATCDEKRWDALEQCPVCRGPLSQAFVLPSAPSPPTDPLIDLRVDQIEDPVEMDLTELDQFGRTLVEGELRLLDVPYRWEDGILIVPPHGDPIVRRLLLTPKPAEGQQHVVPDVVPDAPDRRVPPVGAEPMSRVSRVLAGIADTVLLTLFVYIPAYAFLTDRVPGRGVELTPLGRWFVALAPVVYAACFITVLAATPGKRFFGGAVQKVTGQRPDVITATIRAVVPSAVALVHAFFPTTNLFDTAAGSWLGTIWLAVVYLPLLVHPQRRGLHDRLAGTVVVSVRPRTRDRTRPAETR